MRTRKGKERWEYRQSTIKKTDVFNFLERKLIKRRGKIKFTREDGMIPIKSKRNVASMVRIINEMNAILEENNNRAKYQEVKRAAGYMTICKTFAPSMTLSASLEKKAMSRCRSGG
jgi:hypothetical protein